MSSSGTPEGRDERRAEPNQQQGAQNGEGSVPLPRVKDKKKVEFVNNDRPQQENRTLGSPLELTSDQQGYFGPFISIEDYNNRNGSNNNIPRNPSPPRSEIFEEGEAFNRDELTARLAEILKPEHHGGPMPPVKPRPVLRRQTTVENASELLTPPHRSEVEAKNRADRLALKVGNSSAATSRRSSIAQSDSDNENPFEDQVLLNDFGTNNAATRSNLPLSQAELVGLRARKPAQQTANDLVRSHTRRKSPLSRPYAVPRSGTATPVPHDVEYVPHPERYRGGILANLLKLYNSEEKNGVESSAPTTPNRTPNRTPISTPPTSRPGTPGVEGRRTGLRGLQNRSSTTLSGLLESSFMFATPGSRDISEAVSEKLKQDKERIKKKPKSKQKLEQFRITVHIAEIITRHQYLIKLCHCLMMYGAPTHRIEAYMSMSARVLEIESHFVYQPGLMIISFDDSNTHTSEMKIVRSNQGVDLGRLRDVHEIYKEVVHDRLGAEEATARLNDVINRRDKFPTWFRVILFGVASAFVAPFGFEGRYIDMPICFILGCLVGFLQLYLVPANDLYANVFEITAAIATSFFARVFGSIRGGSIFCFSALAQSSIALILPGYMVLCASLELQNHQMTPGAVRMMYALIYSLFLGYGITIGSVIYGYMDDKAVSAVHCSVGSQWYEKRPNADFYFLFVVPFTLCLCVINQAKWRQTPVMLFIALAGYLVNSFSSRAFQGSAILSSTLGALCIGVLANLYSRLGYAQQYVVAFWNRHVQSRIQHRQRRQYYRNPTGNEQSTDESGRSSTTAAPPPDPEQGLPRPSADEANKTGNPMLQRARKVGYGLAAAAMLPAIFVQVPSGLAVSGSLLSGVISADQITRNETLSANGTTLVESSVASADPVQSASLNNTPFNVLLSVIQVAIGISVGLSISALVVYPTGKRRSGLFAF